MQSLLILGQAAEQGATRLVLPKTDELVFGVVAFVLFFVVVVWKVIPRFRAAMATREATIRGELERAEQARLEAEQAKQQFTQQMAQSRSQADQLVREAQAQAEQTRRDIIARAEQEARAIRERAQADLAQERQRALASLHGEVADISLQAAQRVVEKELSDPSAQRRLVEQFISRLGS